MGLHPFSRYTGQGGADADEEGTFRGMHDFLVQAYLEEEGRDGLLLVLALDWEKAFDRVSWDYYHLALEALEFGPYFRGWARLLSNPDALPTRRIKANGRSCARTTRIHARCNRSRGCCSIERPATSPST
eukprot:scaffold14998_cov121-Isochrysis_galbana.AAC.3